MLRACFLSAAVAAMVGYSADVRAQVGYGAVQSNLTTGASVQVAPVVTNGGTYVRMGIGASFSQLIDVQTFSPVQGFPGLMHGCDALIA